MEKSGLFHRPIIPPHHTSNTMTNHSNSPRRRHPIRASNGNAIRTLTILAIITIFLVFGIFVKLLPAKVSLITSSKAEAACLHGKEQGWHGGHPAEDRPGSCWCGGDDYCMCTPSLAIDIVLYSKTETKDGYSVWAVRRSDTGQMATIGGWAEPFIDVLMLQPLSDPHHFSLPMSYSHTTGAAHTMAKKKIR